MNYTVKRQFIDQESQGKNTLPKLTSLSLSSIPTQPLIKNLPQEKNLLLAKIMNDATQINQTHFEVPLRQSSSMIKPISLGKFKIQCVIDVIDLDQQILNLLGNPYKYAVYELMNYCLCLVGPVTMQLGVADRIGVYVHSQCEFKYRDKPFIKIQRKQIVERKDILEYNYFVYEPSQTLYPTLIFKWLSCHRNTFLQTYFGANQSNYYMVLGLAGHFILQSLIKNQISLENDKQEIFANIYQSNIQEMFILKMNKEQFIKDCKTKLSSIFQFYRLHLKLGQEMEIDKAQKHYLKLTKIIGAQYSIKSKIFGMKGKIDLLIECDFIDKKQKTTRRVLVPIQMKTGGKQNHTHYNQVHVYNTILFEIFNVQTIGLLYYPVLNRFIPVRSNTLNLHQILIKRNQYVQSRKTLTNNAQITLPKHVSNPGVCSTCKMHKQCVSSCLASQVKEIQDLYSIPNYQHTEPIKQIIKQIKVKSKQYIEKWLQLLHLQERAKDRELMIGIQMGLDKFKIITLQKLIQGIKKKEPSVQIMLRSNKLKDGQLSILEGMYKTGQRLRMNVSESRVSMYIQISKIEKLSDRFIIISKVILKNITFQLQTLPTQGKLQVELQKFKSFQCFSELRSMVVQYSLSVNVNNKNKQHGSYKYIIENQKTTTVASDTKTKWYFDQNIKDNDAYNEDQRQAIRKALFMKDYSLVEGFPGTGKTFLIIQLIRVYRQLGLKVLITSFTNNSLNNILQRLLELNLDKKQILRFGNKNLNEGNFGEFCFNASLFSSIQEISQFFKSKYVWMVTLSSLFSELIPSDFDVVIVDQASQCIQPLCLNAILKAKKFVLVGDYKQLGPVIVDRYAESKGMKVSLFERLCKGYPQFTTALKKQWRMCSEIMELSNNLVYCDSLQCATQLIGSRRLQLKEPSKLQNFHVQVQKIIAPSQPIVFLTLDSTISSLKTSIQDQISLNRAISHIEVKIVSNLYSTLINLGIPRKQVCIISFFNKSNSKITKILQQQKILDFNKGDVLTIDKSQGIDKECIIFLMESSSDFNVLARDVSRINVALTRAKSKLIVVTTKEEAEQVLDNKVFKILRNYQFEISEDLAMVFLD